MLPWMLLIAGCDMEAASAGVDPWIALIACWEEELPPVAPAGADGSSSSSNRSRRGLCFPHGATRYLKLFLGAIGGTWEVPT